MEQGITQLGLSVASVTDELNSLNDLSDVLNKKDNNTNKSEDEKFFKDIQEILPNLSQLIATNVPKGDKSNKLLQNLSCASCSTL